MEETESLINICFKKSYVRCRCKNDNYTQMQRQHKMRIDVYIIQKKFPTLPIGFVKITGASCFLKELLISRQLHSEMCEVKRSDMVKPQCENHIAKATARCD